MGAPALACEKGHAEVAMALLKKGADVHAKTSAGSMPMHRAQKNKVNDIVPMLRENGADEVR